MASIRKIFIVGGTGAQGMPVVRGLAGDGRYAVRLLTRDVNGARAKELAAISPKVELMQGSFMSEADLRRGYEGCQGVFLNIDGFATGEKTEMFWAARAYELAVEAGIKAFVYGNLDFVYKLSGYNPKYRTGHYDGKGRIGDWMLQQHKENKGKPFYDMAVSLFTTGPYFELVISSFTPSAPVVEEDETGEPYVLWRLPLTSDGAVAHIALEDCGYYVRWLFDHRQAADGLNLQVATEHTHFHEMAAAFQRVTGHKARFIDVSMDEYWATSQIGKTANKTAGYLADPKDPASMTVRQNFTGFWNSWRDSGYNKGVVKRDYRLLDEIHPNRIRSAEEFFRRQDELARQEGSSLWEKVRSMRPVLKNHEDGRRQNQAE